VAHHLRDAGFAVRVMSRSGQRARTRFPEPFEVVEGNALDRADVEHAVTGCDAVHISIDHDLEDECISHVVEAAQAQRLGRITYVSGTTVCEENRWFPLVDRKLASEHAIRTSGIDYTIFCPGWFMEMLPRFVPGGRAIVFDTPTRRWHIVALQDFARMVVESYRQPDAINRRFHIHGPEALTILQAVQAYARALHPEIRTVRRVPYWLARLSAWVGRNPERLAGVTMVSYLEQVGERGDPAEANAILGPPAITLSRWLAMQQTAEARDRVARS
jgi:uncharacterized protein YbjT (DUF2867 family)